MNTFFNFIKKYYLNIWVRNGVLFSVMIFINLLGNEFDNPKNRENPLALFVLLVIVYVMVFVHNHLFIRLLLFTKKYFLYFISLVFYSLVFCFLLMTGFPFLLNNPKMAIDLPNSLISIFANSFIASIAYFLHYYFLKYIKVNEIEILNHQTEIEYLKQQVNPHFLLNSLNNLYGVSLSNPGEVPNKIIELTDLLKYQIETSKKEYNSLESEKEFIEKYISYSRWKLQNITINSNQIGELKNYKITPMLFLPLIENAIKYSNFEKNPLISIEWEFKPSILNFTINNKFKDNQNELFSTKNGLKNLKKRLELFHPDSKLIIDESNNNYTVNLSIWNLSTLV